MNKLEIYFCVQSFQAQKKEVLALVLVHVGKEDDKNKRIGKWNCIGLMLIWGQQYAKSRPTVCKESYFS